MQDLRRYCNDVVRLDLNQSPPSPATKTTISSSFFSIDDVESAETKIQRLISEHPVIIFSRSSCCMCHAMKNLLANLGVLPAVIELEENEISALPSPRSDTSSPPWSSSTLAPATFIGGACIGGLESLVALHLSGLLVPKLVEVGAFLRFDDLTPSYI